jgi:hypothetical protein
MDPLRASPAHHSIFDLRRSAASWSPTATLFDHLVGALPDRFRHGEAEQMARTALGLEGR